MIPILLFVAQSVAAYTYIRTTQLPTYPPSCLFLSSQSLTVSQLNRSIADAICAERYTCAGARAFMSFDGDAIVDEYTCDDTGLYVCDTYIEIGKSTIRAITEPLYRTLFDSGMNDTEYWSLTSVNGEYEACVRGDTVTNAYLFDGTASCSGSYPFMCLCIDPYTVRDELIVLTQPYFRHGEISLINQTIRVIVPGWYVTSLDSYRMIDTFDAGALPDVSGEFSMEKVNVVKPYDIALFMQLSEILMGFTEEYNEGVFTYSQSRVGNNYTISIVPPREGMYDLITLLDEPALIRMHDCGLCASRFCQCMRYLNESFDVRINVYTQTLFTSRISIRYIVN